LGFLGFYDIPENKVMFSNIIEEEQDKLRYTLMDRLENSRWVIAFG